MLFQAIFLLHVLLATSVLTQPGGLEVNDDSKQMVDRQVFIPRMGKLLNSRDQFDADGLGEQDRAELMSEPDSEEEEEDSDKLSQRSVPPLPRLGKYMVRTLQDNSMDRSARQIYMKTPRVGRSDVPESRQKRMLPRVGYRQLDSDSEMEVGGAADDLVGVVGEQEKRAMPLPRLGYYARNARAAPLPRLGALKRALDQLYYRPSRRVSMLRMGKRRVSMLRMGKRAVSMLRMGRSPAIQRHQRRVSMLRMGKKSDANYETL